MNKHLFELTIQIYFTGHFSPMIFIWWKASQVTTVDSRSFVGKFRFKLSGKWKLKLTVYINREIIGRRFEGTFYFKWDFELTVFN